MCPDLYYDYELPAPALRSAISGLAMSGDAVAQPYGEGDDRFRVEDTSTRTGTPLGLHEVRPITSTSGAGFSTKPTEAVSFYGDKLLSTSEHCTAGAFDPLGNTEQNALLGQAEYSSEHHARRMESQVHKTFEDSVIALGRDHYEAALEKAKEAGKKERALCKFREAHDIVDNIHMELTYAICFNLAHSYHMARLHDEAVHTYSLLIKSKQYTQSGRLRVNLGNIYFEQQRYQLAVRMYRMALDQIPNSGKRTRFNILRNMGNAFVHLGQMGDAVQSYETILGGHQNFHTAFNLIICYYALGDVDKMRTGLQKMLSIPYVPAVAGTSSYSSSLHAEGQGNADFELDGRSPPAGDDALQDELRRREKEARYYVLTASRLIAPALQLANDPMSGFRFAIDVLKSKDESLASDMELECALHYLRDRDFLKAVDALKLFERRDQQFMAMASTNLSFIYFLEGDMEPAQRYADLACGFDRYNAKALVNKGNCLAMKSDYAAAKQFYLEAIGAEADCAEAIYNLGLVNFQLEAWCEALQAFEKLHQVVPNSAEVIFQLAVIHEVRGHLNVALRWYTILATHVPCDSSVLRRMGQLCSGSADELQALHFHLESYRHYPASLDVISWLGVWYVKSEMYERAVRFFEQASQMQPTEVKWQLMVTSCFRRMGDISRALKLYRQVYSKHPENAECLRYLIAICKDLGYSCEQYQSKLANIERVGDEVDSSGIKGCPPKVTLTEGAAGVSSASLHKVSQASNAEVPSTRNEEFNDADISGLLPL